LQIITFIDSKTGQTRNLAIANRSRVSSTHTHSSNEGVIHGEKDYETPLMAAAAGSINFTMG